MANAFSSQAMIAEPEAPLATGSMQDIYRRLCAIHDQASASCGVLEDIGDRAFGAAVVPMAKSADAPKMTGLAYQISDILSQIVTLQERTRDAIHRVSAAI